MHFEVEIMDRWHFSVLSTSDLLHRIYIFAVCDLTPSLVCVDKTTAGKIRMPPDQSPLRVTLLRILYKLQGFATSDATLNEAFLILRHLTNMYNIISGTWLGMGGSWLKQCIVEYQNLVSPFLTIGIWLHTEGSWLKQCTVENQNLVSPLRILSTRESGGRYAWEIRRQAALFFSNLEKTKVSRVSLDEIHKSAITKFERLHSKYPQHPLSLAASKYRNIESSSKGETVHSFKCLQQDCAILASDYHWVFYTPPRCMRPCFFYDTVAEDTPPSSSDNSDESGFSITTKPV